MYIYRFYQQILGKIHKKPETVASNKNGCYWRKKWVVWETGLGKKTLLLYTLL